MKLARLRVQELALRTLLGEGECTACRVQAGKIFRVSCNLGFLNLCVACIDAAERRQKRFEAGQLKLIAKKKTRKGRKRKYVQVYQGGSPGLGK